MRKQAAAQQPVQRNEVMLVPLRPVTPRDGAGCTEEVRRGAACYDEAVADEVRCLSEQTKSHVPGPLATAARVQVV